MNERTKDVSFEDRRYRIRKMTPQVGSWIAMQLLSYTLPTYVAMQLAQAGMTLPSSVGKKDMTEADFHNLQDHCLALVDRYADVAGTPVAQPVYVNGVFDPTLNIELPEVMLLTAHALLFNMLSFFAEGILKKMVNSFKVAYQDSPLFHSLLSMSSPGDQS